MLSVILAALLPTWASFAPPEVTDVQKTVMAAAVTAGTKCSNAAQQTVLKYLDNKDFRHEIRSSSVANYTAALLLEWFIDNVNAAPIMSNFDTSHWNWVVDHGYLPNLWELQVLGQGHGNQVIDLAETSLYGFPNFKNPGAPGNLVDAQDRPNYLAWNIWRKADGDLSYGTEAFVVREEYRKFMALAPLDTGRYTYNCTLHPHSASPLGDPSLASNNPLNCKAWSDHCIGDHTHIYHFILSHTSFYSYNLSALVMRMDLKARPIKYDWYYEAAFCHGFLVPEVVLYSIAFYNNTWSTLKGNKIRKWSVNKNRALAWAGGEDALLVDPAVARSLAKSIFFYAYTVTEADVQLFTTQWQTLKPGQWDVLYNATSPVLRAHFLLGSEHKKTCPQQAGKTCPTGGCEAMFISNNHSCIWAKYAK